jgi:hypothetical protein
LLTKKGEWGLTCDCQSHLFNRSFLEGTIYMTNNSIYLTEIVSDYINHGLAPIPIHYKSKQPVNKGWTELRISKEDIGTYLDGHPINIGILTGPAFGGLIDIDIDDADALRFGSWLLA